MKKWVESNLTLILLGVVLLIAGTIVFGTIWGVTHNAPTVTIVHRP